MDTREQAARLMPLAGRLRRAVNRGVRARIGDLPLSEAQVDVLRAVLHAGSAPRIQDVARRLRLAPNTVSTLVTTLVQRGMLTRQPDAHDGRVVRLAVTAQARRRIETWRAHRTDLVAAHIDQLADGERRALQRALPVLEQLVAALESGNA